MPDDTGQGGNLSNVWKDLNNDNASSLEITAGVLGTLADLGGAIGFIQLGVSLIEPLLDLDDQAQSALAAIEAGLNQLLGQIAASDKLQRMRDVDAAITPAAGVFQQLPAILAANPPVTEDFKLAQIQTCVDAVLSFTDSDVKWQVVAADMAYYSDSWSGALAPQAGSDGLVFNYTYTLPQFLRAIYFLLAAIAGLAPTSLQSYNNILTKCLTRLQSAHQTISSGIVAYREPDSDVVGTVYYLEPKPPPGQLVNGQPVPPGQGIYYSRYVGDGFYQPGEDGWDSLSQNHFVCASVWAKDPTSGSARDGIAWPYGAVDIYSGANNVGSYFSDYFPFAKVDVSFWPQAAIDHFLRLLNVRVQQKMRSLYVSLGMPAVWQTINKLLTLTGGQPLPSTPDYDDWPYTDLIDQLRLTWTPPPGHHVPIGGTVPREPADPPGFENALRAVLLATPPYAEFQAFTNGTISGFDPVTGDWYAYLVSIPPTPLTTGSLYSFLTGISLAPVLGPPK